MATQRKSPQAATGGREKHEVDGLSLLNMYPQDAVEVKAACMFCGFFKVVDLKRGRRLLCSFWGERIQPNNACSFFEEAGGQQI